MSRLSSEWACLIRDEDKPSSIILAIHLSTSVGSIERRGIAPNTGMIRLASRDCSAAIVEGFKCVRVDVQVSAHSRKPI